MRIADCCRVKSGLAVGVSILVTIVAMAVPPSAASQDGGVIINRPGSGPKPPAKPPAKPPEKPPAKPRPKPKPAPKPPAKAPLDRPVTILNAPASTEPEDPIYLTESFEIGDDLTVAMVLVPPGTFTMGSPNGEEDDQPLHRVTISMPFYLGKFEVTQRQWTAVMGSNPSRFQGDDLPVEQITWGDAQEFLKRLNARTGGGWRLPTEAEWEYACRTGAEGDYAGDLDAVAWYVENSRGRTHPVGSKRPNAGGLFDMHGNVLEWCQDWHASYTADDKLDPVKVSGGVCRIVRGGSWNDDAEACRSGYRFWLAPDNANALIGLRLARNAESR